MPRNYIRKTNKNCWKVEDMDRAIKAVRGGCPIKRASLQFNVPYATLWDKLKQGKTTSRLGRNAVFSLEDEREIVCQLKILANMFHGLTPLELRRACFEYAEEKQLNHPFNRIKKLAGKDWYYGFLRRNGDISIRKPEATSFNRINAFNKHEVGKFFNNLESVYERYKFGPEHVFNVDETGVTNVHVPDKVLAAKGTKRLGAITSGERGQTITAVCAMSASGVYVPPMFIYPRQRLPEHLCKGGPAGSIYKCSKSGWITEDLFILWLEHFQKHVHSSSENPVLLIMDNHVSHVSYRAYRFCKQHGIVVVSLPPHTSHRLQPLDVTFFSPLKTAYNQECSSYLKVNSFERISQDNVPLLFSRAYNRVATIEKAVRGFESTGICPLNKNIFPDEEFAAGENVQDIDIKETADPENLPSTSGISKPRVLNNNDSSDSSELEEISDNEDCTLDKTLVKRTFSEIAPVPVRKERTCKRKNKKHSIIFTSTPNKDILEEQEKKKENKRMLDDRKRVKKQLVPDDVGTRVINKNILKHVQIQSSDIDKDICSFCGEFGRNNELWFCCSICTCWAHAACTDAESAEGYICDKCR